MSLPPGRTLLDLTASEATAAIATHAITSEDLTRACLDAAARLDVEIGAWAALDPDHALAQARAADALLRSGLGFGPLHGVPIAIKDVIETADLPTENGSPIFRGHRPERDAVCVANLRAAGAVILGKTVTTELASLTPAPTRNPAAAGRTPGGSSSGSAAAVASRMVPAALGTQTAGSVIRPASFCGTYGFKPTLGLVSRRGVLLQSQTLDTVGALARSLEDLALVVDAMSGYDADDPVSLPVSRGRLSARLVEPQPATPIFAFVRTPAWDGVEATTKEAWAELIDALGPQVREVSIPSLEEVIEDQKVVQLAENAGWYGPLLDRHADVLSPAMRDRLEQGARIPVRRYLDAIARRSLAYARLQYVLNDFSAILTPASPGPAPTGLASTGNPVFNGLWTYLGTPCVTLPLLEVDGAPIGVQLVGARCDDGRLLRTARWLEQTLAA